MKLHNVSSHMYIYKHGIIELKSILLVQHHSSCMWAVVPLFFFFCVCVCVCVCVFLLGGGRKSECTCMGGGGAQCLLIPLLCDSVPFAIDLS